MDSGKWTILTPILVAIIPFAAAIITPLIVAPNIDKPNIVIENSFSSPPSEIAKTKIKNSGGSIATNVTVFVKSDREIHFAYLATVLDVALLKDNKSLLFSDSPMEINDTSFELYVPELIQGDGGLVVIEWISESELAPQDLEVIAIYDQGSAVGKENLFDIKIPLPGWFVIITVIGEALYFIYYIFVRFKKQRVKNLVVNFIEIRRKLLNDPDTKESFTSTWKNYPFRTFKPNKIDKLLRFDKLIYKINKGMEKPDYYTGTTWWITKYMRNPVDAVKVVDVLDLISIRENLLGSINIKTRNLEILRSIDYVLNNVDWIKYT